MITSSAPPRQSRIFEIALVLSVLTHLLFLLVYFGVFARVAPLLRPVPKDEEYAVSDVIRLEKRTVPKPQVRAEPPKPQPAPHPQRLPAPPIPLERPVPVPKPRVQREVARIVPRAPALPRTTSTAPPAPAAQAPRAVALTPSVPQPQSAADLAAAQEQRFRNIIAQENNTVRVPVAQHIPPSAIKPRSIDMGRVAFEDLHRAFGTVHYIYARGRVGDLDWYIMRVEIAYPDGKTELVDIPWRFYFPRNHDPIASNDPRPFPAQSPPPGFVLPHPFAPSRFVCSFFADECQALDNAEERSGGPAAN